MLKIRISKKELKDLYLGRSTGDTGKTTVYQGEDNVPNGNMVLLRAMLEVFKDKSGGIVFPDFFFFWKDTRRLVREAA